MVLYKNYLLLCTLVLCLFVYLFISLFIYPCPLFVCLFIYFSVYLPLSSICLFIYLFIFVLNTCPLHIYPCLCLTTLVLCWYVFHVSFCVHLHVYLIALIYPYWLTEHKNIKLLTVYVYLLTYLSSSFLIFCFFLALLLTICFSEQTVCSPDFLLLKLR